MEAPDGLGLTVGPPLHPPETGADAPHWIEAHDAHTCREGLATGFPQSLFSIDQILEDSDGPLIFTTHDDEHRYLAIEVHRDEHRRVWMFAPLSERALECTLSGQADLRDVFLHTVTGTVDLVTATDDGAVVESVQLCDSLTEDMLPKPGRHLAA